MFSIRRKNFDPSTIRVVRFYSAIWGLFATENFLEERLTGDVRWNRHQHALSHVDFGRLQIQLQGANGVVIQSTYGVAVVLVVVLWIVFLAT